MISKIKRMYIFNRDGWKCSVCGKQVNFATGQLAHRMARTKANVKQYGLDIIDHEMNLRLTCAACNQLVLIDNSPKEKELLVKSIRAAIERSEKYEHSYER